MANDQTSPMAGHEPLLPLRAGALLVDLAPGCGGSIARFGVERDGKVIEILRPAVPDALAWRDPLGMASFPMIPYCGRIARAQFMFGGETFALDRNFGDSPHSIHGNAWRRVWTVASQSADRAELVLEHDGKASPREWPFSYRARQIFALTAEALRIDVEVVNRDAWPMPLSFGLHPYFPMTPQAALTTKLGGIWESDEGMLPSGLAAVPRDLDFANGRRLAEVTVDSCFAGWDGRAMLHRPGAGLLIEIASSPPFSQFVVYTPPHREYFCAEPQSAAPDAINLAARGVTATGLIVLQPGASARAEVRFALTTLAD
jgi:aldose 1-epimerase